MESQRHRWLLIAAFAAVYLVWGSTYLAIRVAVETLPAFLSSGVRFIIAGSLTIAGKENSIELRGTGSSENGVLRFKGSKQFKMTEYGVKPPSLMLGTMKVGDPVTVSFDLVLSE